MSNRLTLHPSAAAAAQALSEADGGVLLAGDSARGFFAFALEMARRGRPFELPDAAERLTLAWAAAEQAGFGLQVTAAASFARALSNLHGSGLGTEQLQRLQEPKLARALEVHQRLLAQRGLCDPGGVPWLAAEVASKAAGDLPIDALEVLPRVGWTHGELNWLSAIAERVPVTVQLPEDPGRPKLFALLNPIHQELARASRVRLASPAAEWGSLWISSAAGPSERIETHSYGSVAGEARGVALQVRSLLRTGVSPDAIAVVALDGPAPELMAALDAAEVPVAHVEAALRTTLAGQVALGLVSAADEGIPRESLCELLEGRLLDVRHSLGWARHLREAGSGSHRQGRLLPPLEALVARKSHDREGLAELAAVVETIAALPSRASIGAHARSLWRMLRQLGIDARLAKAAPERRAAQARQLGLFEAETAEARGFESPWVEVAQTEATLALDGVRELLDSFASLDDAGGPLALVELSALLGAALDATAAPSARALPGGVTVARAEALSGRRFEYVFLTGLAGDPPPQPEDAFLPERLRHQAREICERPAILGPVGASVSQDQQLIALAMAAVLATERLSASGSRSDEGGRLVEPSPLLAALTRAAARGLQSHALQPWPSSGDQALNRGEACAAIAEEPKLLAAEPVLARVHARLRAQRAARERAILERRIDPFAGDLTAADLTEHLAARLACGAAEPLTATALQTLAGCGFRALAERVLRIRVPEEQDESIDAGRRGTLLHDCLEHGFRALHAAGLLPLGGLAQRSKQREIFQAAVHSRLAASEEAGAVGHPVVWNAQRRGIQRELLQVFEAELESKEALVPTGFEVKLGTEWPSGVLATALGAVHLGGKVDRIDVGPGVGPARRLRVLDYKSGSIGSRNKRFPREFAGRDLQLGHYALALDLGRRQAQADNAQQAAPVASAAGSVDAVYYSIRDATASKSLAEVCEKGGVTLEAFLDASEAGRAQARDSGSPNLPNLVEAHLGRARHGEFPVQPGDCRFCAFGSACRVGGFRENWE